MLIAVIALGALIGFVVGAGAVGMSAQRMGHQRVQPVWRQEVAAEYTESHLAFEVAAELRPDDLRYLLGLHINQLQFGGASGTAVAGSCGAGGSISSGCGSDSGISGGSGAGEPSATEGAVTLTAHEAAVAALYAEARTAGLEISKPVVAEVMRAHFQYLQAIGALVRSPAAPSTIPVPQLPKP